MFFLTISASSPIWTHSSIVLNGILCCGGSYGKFWPMDCERKWIVKGIVFHFWAGHLPVDLKTYSVSFVFPFRKIINNFNIWSPFSIWAPLIKMMGMKRQNL